MTNSAVGKMAVSAGERNVEMELAKIRSLSNEELAHQETTAAEQLFRLRFQVSLGQNDGVKKLRQLRKEIAQEAMRLASNKLPLRTKFVMRPGAEKVVAAAK